MSAGGLIASALLVGISASVWSAYLEGLGTIARATTEGLLNELHRLCRCPAIHSLIIEHLEGGLPFTNLEGDFGNDAIAFSLSYMFGGGERGRGEGGSHTSLMVARK